MNLDQLLDRLRVSPTFRDHVTAWRFVPAREGVYDSVPDRLDPRLPAALAQQGIHRLYCHQSRSIRAALAGEDVVIVTSTASGKTLCYNLPVLDRILKEPSSRALYLFPTKALAQDQYDELHSLIELLGVDVKTYTYDGDTPASVRRAVRLAGHVVITNPDMLHTGILPHHTKWQRLFEQLQFVVIDELHHYRGIFGSHAANVLRRLWRICEFYGSRPQVIACSATIANPLELAARLTGRSHMVVDNDGAPRGARHFVFYNPPVVNRELGVRKSTLNETAKVAGELMRNDVQTLVFARSRVSTEVLLTTLRRTSGLPDGRLRGYRGGYRPLQRREIEAGLRSGEVRGVVSTNALELGIDVGQLEATVLCGYPGSIASTWQQAGRAGRRQTTAAAVLVADSNPLDQFIITHPEYFFGQPPEHGLVNADNFYVLASHLACAVFELPFRQGEGFGTDLPATLRALEHLEADGAVHREGDTWHWVGGDYPAERVSLRSAARDNVVIVDVTDPRPQVLGECDPFSAPMLVHQDAIYLHEGQQYHIVELDWQQKRAYGKRVDVDYYTDAGPALNLGVLEDVARADTGSLERGHGDVRLTFTPTVYKKIRLLTGENVGWGKIDLPPQDMHTTAYWVAVSDRMAEQLGREGLQSAVFGLSNLLVHVAPLFLMCDPRDLVAVPHVRSPFTGRATVFICDNYPGGVGFASTLFQLHDRVLSAAHALARDCPCPNGCPSCVGPRGEVGRTGKRSALELLAAGLASVHAG